MNRFDHGVVDPHERVLTRAGIVAVILSAVILAASSASSAEPLSLEQVVREVLEQSPSLRAARQELEVARGRLVRARYWNRFNPEIEGGLARRRFDDGGSESQASAGGSLEIEIAGQRALRIEEAERNLTRVAAEIADAERLKVAEAKEAFYDSLYLHRRLALHERIEELNERLARASEERFRAGESAKLEANLAVIRHARSVKDTLDADRAHRNRLRDLERLLGREPIGEIRIVGALDLPPSASLDPNSLVDAALERRPDLAARTAELERVQAEIALTKRSVVPNPTIGGGYEEEVEAGGSRDRVFGGSIRIPLPIFDRNQGELVSLSGERGRASTELAATALEVEGEVRDAWSRYAAAREAVATFEKGATARLEESHRLLETAYREGKVGLLSLIAGQNDLIEAELAYLQGLSDYWSAHVALERAVGRALEEGVVP